MRILDRDELDEQRKNYMRYVGALNKLAQGVGDGTRKGEEVRDLTLILQTRFLTFILSELVQMSQMLRDMENQIQVDFLSEMEDQSEDEFEKVFESQIEAEASGYNAISEEVPEVPEVEEAESIEPAPERGSTDLLGRFRGLGLAPEEEQQTEAIPEEELPAEHITEESEDETAPLESDGIPGGTAELLSTLAAIDAETQDEAQRIVDDIYKKADEVEDEEE